MADRIWQYREGIPRDLDVTGFSVEARDGSIGTVEEMVEDAESAYLVVDTARWILGRRVVLPAGLVERVDRDTESVFVDRTKDVVEAAPEYVLEDAGGDQSLREARARAGLTARHDLGAYYGGDPDQGPRRA
jgi:hypothetical protein